MQQTNKFTGKNLRLPSEGFLIGLTALLAGWFTSSLSLSISGRGILYGGVQIGYLQCKVFVILNKSG